MCDLMARMDNSNDNVLNDLPSVNTILGVCDICNNKREVFFHNKGIVCSDCMKDNKVNGGLNE